MPAKTVKLSKESIAASVFLNFFDKKITNNKLEDTFVDKFIEQYEILYKQQWLKNSNSVMRRAIDAKKVTKNFIFDHARTDSNGRTMKILKAMDANLPPIKIVLPTYKTFEFNCEANLSAQGNNTGCARVETLNRFPTAVKSLTSCHLQALKRIPNSSALDELEESMPESSLDSIGFANLMMARHRVL